MPRERGGEQLFYSGHKKAGSEPVVSPFSTVTPRSFHSKDDRLSGSASRQIRGCVKTSKKKLERAGGGADSRFTSLIG